MDTNTAGQGKHRPGDRAGPLSGHAADFDAYRHPYTYNPERVRELLRAAGHANGFKAALAYNTGGPAA
ncbi:MAG TPA: hypothetical protein VGC59_00075 [Solirubrobacteraceae bacterium]